jgi:hypothetical protein
MCGEGADGEASEEKVYDVKTRLEVSWWIWRYVRVNAKADIGSDIVLSGSMTLQSGKEMVLPLMM